MPVPKKLAKETPSATRDAVVTFGLLLFVLGSALLLNGSVDSDLARALAFSACLFYLARRGTDEGEPATSDLDSHMTAICGRQWRALVFTALGLAYAAGEGALLHIHW